MNLEDLTYFLFVKSKLNELLLIKKYDKINFKYSALIRNAVL